MDNRFFENPILNSPYQYPTRHWELDDGRPADPDDRGEPAPGRIHLARSEAEKARRLRQAKEC